MVANLLRDIREADFERILRLNAAAEVETSRLDLSRLRLLLGLSSYHKVAVTADQVAAFLLAMRETAPYENDNHAWFRARYRRFFYVDRIVVAPEFAGRRIGSGLYADLFEFAREQGVPRVVCEYNLEPPNPASKAFHDAFGFRQVGTQQVARGAKRVSLQAAMV
jgi:hypothetical protein